MKYMGFTFTNDCVSTNNMFHQDGVVDQKAHRKYASYDKKELRKSGKASVVYTCYCNTYSSNLEALSQILLGKGDVCYLFFSYKNKQYLFYVGISILISIVNVLIRLIYQQLIKLIGYPHKTQEIRMMVFYIFITQYFNTGLILLFTNAKFEFTIMKGLSGLNKFLPISGGIYSDFTTRWYLEISPMIIFTMMVRAIWPFMNLIIFFGLRLLKRLLDSGPRNCWKRNRPTKKSTIQ